VIEIAHRVAAAGVPEAADGNVSIQSSHQSINFKQFVNDLGRLDIEVWIFSECPLAKIFGVGAWSLDLEFPPRRGGGAPADLEALPLYSGAFIKN
jgi:hypothetical protein